MIRRLTKEHAYQLKFVIDDPRDLEEVDEYLAEFPDLDRNCVMLMPQGTDAATLHSTQTWLEPECRLRGFRFCPRKHVEWYRVGAGHLRLRRFRRERQLFAKCSRPSRTSSPTGITRSRSCVPNSLPSARRRVSPISARLTITYIPDRRCVELKSLKLYLQQYRNEGHFLRERHESDPRRSGRRAAAAAPAARRRLQRAGRHHHQRHGLPRAGRDSVTVGSRPVQPFLKQRAALVLAACRRPAEPSSFPAAADSAAGSCSSLNPARCASAIVAP